MIEFFHIVSAVDKMSSSESFPAGPKWSVDSMKGNCTWHVAMLCSDKWEPAASNRGGACEDKEEG